VATVPCRSGFLTSRAPHPTRGRWSPRGCGPSTGRTADSVGTTRGWTARTARQKREKSDAVGDGVARVPCGQGAPLDVMHLFCDENWNTDTRHADDSFRRSCALFSWDSISTPSSGSVGHGLLWARNVRRHHTHGRIRGGSWYRSLWMASRLRRWYVWPHGDSSSWSA